MSQRPHTQLTPLLGAILLSSGLASSLALADAASSVPPDSASADTTASTEEKTDAQAKSNIETDAETASALRQQPEMVEIRISLPDGRTIIRMEPARARSARSNLRFTNSSHRTLPDGSHISVAARAVSGGSNSSSLRSGGSSGGGGGSSGGGSAGGGGSSGGGGGGSSLAASAGRSLTPGGTSEGIVEGARAESASEAASSAAPRSSRGGVFQVTNNTSNFAVQGGATPSQAGTAPSQGGATPSQGGTQQADPVPVIPTVGGPRFDDDGDATGGQRVEFHEAGMSAAVIGNMVYFIGVEFVRADQDFSVVEGTRIGTDSVVRQDLRPSNAGVDALSSFNVGASTIRLGYPSDTVVQLVMQSLAENPNNPDRTQRTWTVRIR